VAADTIRIVQSGETTFGFDPPAVRVPIYQSITWVNSTETAIRVIADDNSTFDSGFIGPGETFVYTPLLVGTTTYRNGAFPAARGSVVVMP
jgi:hypothetical protein